MARYVLIVLGRWWCNIIDSCSDLRSYISSCDWIL